ncbi:MAG TPA: hypothetical protein VMF52_08015 [Steroidobacteraceae bacterium]|nr:hypothetical protein [Steroidobacteraceae bacterium]
MKSPVLGLALSTLAFGASSVYLWVQLDEQREQAAAVSQANTELTARLAEFDQRRNAFAQHRLNGPGPGPGGTPPPPGALAMNGPPSSAKTDATEDASPWRNRNRTMENAPEMPAAMVKMMRANMRAQNKKLYFDLQSRLGLSADDTNAMLDLITDQQAGGFRRFRNQNPEQARDSWEAEQAKSKAQITDLLGPAKATEFEEYQKTMPSRSELLMISQQLEGVDTPLTDDQRTKLLATLVEERERIPMPTFETGEQQADYQKTYSEWQADYEKRVADQARGILSSEQLSTYQEYQTWQQQMREQFAVSGGPPMRGMRGGGPMFMAAPAGGVAFAVTTETNSSRPTENTARPK